MMQVNWWREKILSITATHMTAVHLISGKKEFGSALIKSVIIWAWSKVSTAPSSRGCSILDIIWRSFIYQQRKGRESGVEGPHALSTEEAKKGFWGEKQQLIPEFFSLYLLYAGHETESDHHEVGIVVFQIRSTDLASKGTR